ncbi:MAG: ABC transporter substrate-binding protein [Oscillospiraceae bacterium]|nr:ABC transporter substrate-binding protein [Oscillospiraceae bacterium]
MKRIITLISLSAFLFAVLVGCGRSGAKPPANAGVVNVYNWGEYIDTDLLTQFKAETGITVNYRTFESNEQLYSVLKQGGVSYDVIIPSDYMISRLISEDMLEKINFDNIPNLSLIDEDLRFIDYDPTGEYSVPYTWGTVGIIWNESMIADEITSWSALFDERYSGMILMIDNSRDAFGIALKYLGHSQNTTNEAELYEAFDLLAAQKPLLQQYVMDAVYDKLESAEASVGVYYAGDYLTMLESNPDLRFVIPKEGSNKFIDCMCILKGAENRENAEAFINFMCSTDASLANAEYIGYTSPNTEVRDIIELDDLSREIMYPSREITDRCEFFINLPPETLSLLDELWTRLKA